MKSWEIKTKIPKPKRAQRKAESWWEVEGRQQRGPEAKANPVPKGAGEGEEACRNGFPAPRQWNIPTPAPWGKLHRERTSFLKGLREPS